MGRVLGTAAAHRVVDAVREYLPRGQLLPEDAWRRRHRTLSILLRAHVVGLLVFALVRGFTVVHSVNEAAAVALFAVLAWAGQNHRRFSSAMCALGLMMSSAVREILTGVEAVIVDEIHAVAQTKRGSHLSLTLERLDHLVRTTGEREQGIQRIGLSATQRPLERIDLFFCIHCISKGGVS